MSINKMVISGITMRDPELRSAAGETCATCSNAETSTLRIGGAPVEVGYCRKYGCFMSGEELHEDQRAEGCWE